MRSRLTALLFAVFCALPTWAEEPPKIREFDLKTIEALGQELYRRDHLASVATDLLIAQYPEAQRRPIKGWVSILGEELSTVYFIQERDNILSLAYTANFPRDDRPVVKDQTGEALPEAVRTRFLARRTGFAAAPVHYTRDTNVEVLDDPTGHGFLVYVLASSSEPNQMIVGGHYRVTVSADGRKAEMVDALSRGLFVLSVDPPEAPKDAKVVAAYMTHVVSPTPVETHVFVSLLHHKTFYVSTSPTDLWKIEKGTITKTTLQQ